MPYLRGWFIKRQKHYICENWNEEEKREGKPYRWTESQKEAIQFTKEEATSIAAKLYDSRPVKLIPNKTKALRGAVARFLNSSERHFHETYMELQEAHKDLESFLVRKKKWRYR